MGKGGYFGGSSLLGHGVCGISWRARHSSGKNKRVWVTPKPAAISSKAKQQAFLKAQKRWDIAARAKAADKAEAAIQRAKDLDEKVSQIEKALADRQALRSLWRSQMLRPK